MEVSLPLPRSPDTLSPSPSSPTSSFYTLGLPTHLLGLCPSRPASCLSVWWRLQVSLGGGEGGLLHVPRLSAITHGLHLAVPPRGGGDLANSLMATNGMKLLHYAAQDGGTGVH